MDKETQTKTQAKTQTNTITTWNRQREDYLNEVANSYLDMMTSTEDELTRPQPRRYPWDVTGWTT